MSIRHYMKTILLFGVGTLLHAEVSTQPFDVESGMVYYEIRGGAQLTPETNLSIKGEAKLRFKEWGEVKLEEESGIVVTTGAIKHKQHVKSNVKVYVAVGASSVVVDYCRLQRR